MSVTLLPNQFKTILLVWLMNGKLQFSLRYLAYVFIIIITIFR